MAKRKAARATGRKAAAGGRGRAAAKKAAPRRRPGHGGRTAAGRSGSAKRARGGSAKGTKKKTATRKKPVAAGRRAPKVATRRTAATKRTGRAAKGAKPVAPRKAPALSRERRVIRDDEDLIQETPPSSLDLDRSASAVRSGRRNLSERYKEHTETSPAITGGDVDADWESAYSVGDEAPGGDSPTPDQDIVDDIGRAVGIEYQDNEELKGAKKVEQRDKHRWELDPASSEDWEDR